MTQQELMEVVKRTADGLSAILGEQTEIVVHDLSKGEIVYILHGEITGRTAGMKGNKNLYEVILKLAGDKDWLVGYASASRSGKSLKASHLIYRKNGKPAALICINQDTSELLAAKEILEKLTASRPLELAEEAPDETGSSGNDIRQMMQRVIVDAIERVKPLSMDTKTGRMEILRTLDKKGVFDVKDAVPQVCSILSVSQASLYNYLREIRLEENGLK